MFDGKNKRKNKVLAHLMSYALVFALFNRGMMLGEYDDQTHPQQQDNAQSANYESEMPNPVESSSEVAVAHFSEELQAAVDADYIDIIELAQDIELEQTLVIPEDAEVTIDGNGNSIQWAFAEMPAIQISLGAALTLENIEVEGQGGLFDFDAVGIEVNQGGELTMGAGSIVRGFTGSGVVVNGGSFMLDGGTVTDNGSDGFGGGVRLDNGSFVMNNGEIRGNHALQGGGIFAQGASSIQFNGGQIHNNTAEEGGGIYLAPPADGSPNSEGILTEFGEEGVAAIFDNHSNADYQPIANQEPYNSGLGIDDSAKFIEAQGEESETLPFAFIWPPDEEGNDEAGKVPENPLSEIEDEEIAGEENEGAEAESEEDEAQDELDSDSHEKPSEEAESESAENEPQEIEPEEPQNSLADLMVTNPQTGDEFSFFGLVISAVAFTVSAFVVFVYRERERLERARMDCATF